MEERMTDYQFNSIIKMVITILKKSKTLEDAIAELEALLKK